MSGYSGYNNSTGWDENNSPYDTEEPSEEDNLDHCRLHVKNLPKGLNQQGLEMAFSKYGTLTECFVSTDPKKHYGLVRFETPGEAKQAMMKLNHTEPLRLNISIAYKMKKKMDTQDNARRNNYNNNSNNNNNRRTVNNGHVGTDRDRSYSSRYSTQEMAQGDISISHINDLMDHAEEEDEDVELTLQKLRKMLYRQKLNTSKTAAAPTGLGARCVLPGGRIVVNNDPNSSRRLKAKVRWANNLDSSGDYDGNYAACGGDTKERDSRARKRYEDSADGSSTPSTCVVESDVTKYHKVQDKSKDQLVKTGHVARNDVTVDLKNDFDDTDSENDETDRLIELRAVDYLGIVDDDSKIVVALDGYPKTKMGLRHLELFRKNVDSILDMQLKAGLLKKTPVFLDYYLSRGAIVCICKDFATKEWLVRICPGLQERIGFNVMLLSSKCKRMCLALLRIPKSSWPATAKDVFLLLQYFNPLLKTKSWKIYSQKLVDDIEITKFLVDRVSGEIIRGMGFYNIIDYGQIEFELCGYSEIYYDCLVFDDEIHSIQSRVKLLNELRSAGVTPVSSNVNLQKDVAVQHNGFSSDESSDTEDEIKTIHYSKVFNPTETIQSVTLDECKNTDKNGNDLKENIQPDNVIIKMVDSEHPDYKNSVVSWSGDANLSSDEENEDNAKKTKCSDSNCEEKNEPDTSKNTESEASESVYRSTLSINSNATIESNRGMSYHRRTNYLDVEDELKIAVVLEGYPQNKLEGIHVRRFKYLFNEYVHKDMKRFNNLIIPKFQDFYLSNGAVIYICDSLETKDYLTETLPKFVNATGLRLEFKDLQSLVRYTRLVMRLPKDLANIESLDILLKLQEDYPALKLEDWKFYSNAIGKQKRQFGVDPASLAIIRSPDFKPMYKGENLEFRIIDRQKRDSVSKSLVDSPAEQDVCNNNDSDQVDSEANLLKDKVIDTMHVPIDTNITKVPLAKTRSNHYCDLIADDLKLYVGPADYPDSRIYETMFLAVRRSIENLVFRYISEGAMSEDDIPKFHDMYLFDGVIFVICANVATRAWIAEALPEVSASVRIQLKATEYRGPVGIVNMSVETDKSSDEVIQILQRENPRLRTHFWRKISTAKSEGKLDVVLQIDKCSAQVISSSNFNSHVGINKAVSFQLGSLKSKVKPKASLEELTKKLTTNVTPKSSKGTFKSRAKFTIRAPNSTSYQEVTDVLKKEFPGLKTESWKVLLEKENDIFKLIDLEIDNESSTLMKRKNYEDTFDLFTDDDELVQCNLLGH
ncbi:unnamed protein product [Plutella xylostella]|uniref:(diamondback moth) hypothetical protein n=1 Tax=Plutella xylostella TaxID=51655 RepID=A0A8S4F004_PLUXY|nr:unnamed protein product [Plutella xylostella]